MLFSSIYVQNIYDFCKKFSYYEPIVNSLPEIFHHAKHVSAFIYKTSAKIARNIVIMSYY